MTDHADILDQVRQANPIPGDGLPQFDEASSRRMLEAITAGQSRRRRIASGRARIGLGLVAVAGAAVAAAVTLTSHSSAPSRLGHSGQFQLVWPATIAAPLGPQANQVSLADAPAALGAPVTLPNSSMASSANLGTLWTANYGGDNTVVAVTFPQAGLIVEYERPAQTPPAIYPTLAQEHPNFMSVTDLNGVPALEVAQNSNQSAADLSSVEFVAGGTQITVLGHDDEATLKSVAQSILDNA